MSTSDQPQPLGELLSDGEIAELNAAQRVLHRLSRRCADGAWRQPASTAFALGMLTGAADDGRDALFHVLNVAASRDLVTVSREQLHNHAYDWPVRS